MAVTLAIFAALQLAMPLWIRPHLFSAGSHHGHDHVHLRHIVPDGGSQGTFTLTTEACPASPAPGSSPAEPSTRPGNPIGTSPAACLPTLVNGGSTSGLNCLASHGVQVAVTYQPASRFWAFQWTETAIFLVLALALAGCCFWRLQRRRS